MGLKSLLGHPQNKLSCQALFTVISKQQPSASPCQQCHAAWHPPASLPSVGIDGSDRAQKMWLLALVWLDVNKQILNFNPYKGKINLSFYVFQDNLSDHVNSFAKLHRKTECIRNI